MQLVPAGGLIEPNTCVVPGSEIVRAEILRLAEQLVELDAAVAFDAGVWGAAARVFAHESIDHLLGEVVAEVQHVMRNSDSRGGAARVLDRAERAAAAVLAVLGVLLPYLKRDSDHVVPLPLEQSRRNRAIYPAAHGGDYR